MPHFPQALVCVARAVKPVSAQWYGGIVSAPAWRCYGRGRDRGRWPRRRPWTCSEEV